MSAARVVYAIGDSLIGTDTTRGQPLFYLRSALGPAAYTKAQGNGGETSAEVLARLERDVIDCTPRPDTCIVLAGINDVRVDVPPEQIVANLQAVHAALLDAGVRVIALNLYPFGNHADWTPAREAARREVRHGLRIGAPARSAVELIDVEDVVGDLGDPRRPLIRADYDDGTGLHLNALGGVAVAEALKSRSRLLLAPPR